MRGANVFILLESATKRNLLAHDVPALIYPALDPDSGGINSKRNLVSSRTRRRDANLNLREVQNLQARRAEEWSQLHLRAMVQHYWHGHLLKRSEGRRIWDITLVGRMGFISTISPSVSARIRLWMLQSKQWLLRILVFVWRGLFPLRLSSNILELLVCWGRIWTTPSKLTLPTPLVLLLFCWHARSVRISVHWLWQFTVLTSLEPSWKPRSSFHRTCRGCSSNSQGSKVHDSSGWFWRENTPYTTWPCGKNVIPSWFSVLHAYLTF